MPAWTFDDIPDQTARLAIVTGANTGIGYETARALARKGARVVLACRSVAKAEEAAGRIRAEAPAGSVEVRALDLSDLDAVRAFSDAFHAEHDRLDLLVNNAGVMMPPFDHTKQGFELQLGTNHFGHFALVGHLLPLLRTTPGSRVVVVSSGMHHGGRLDFEDLDYARRKYAATAAYSASKLANLLFALELQRRLGTDGPRVTAAHPGWTATDLQRHSGIFSALNPYFAMKPADGALPTLRAATDPAAHPGSYWGPSGVFEMSGPPVPARINAKALDTAVAARLWEVSEARTGVCYDFGKREAI